MPFLRRNVPPKKVEGAYTLTLFNKILPFATVRIQNPVDSGHGIRFKGKLYRVLEVNQNDIIVSKI